MNLADNSTGNLKKGITAVGGVLDALGTKANAAKVFMKLGIDPGKAKGDVTAQIGQILQATKGNKDKLAVAFQGEQLKLLVDLGKTYAGAFDATKGDVKAKTAAALGAYQEALKKGRLLGRHAGRSAARSVRRNADRREENGAGARKAPPSFPKARGSGGDRKTDRRDAEACGRHRGNRRLRV
jgi:hypothetical protein